MRKTALGKQTDPPALRQLGGCAHLLPASAPVGAGKRRGPVPGPGSPLPCPLPRAPPCSSDPSAAPCAAAHGSPGPPMPPSVSPRLPIQPRPHLPPPRLRSGRVRGSRPRRRRPPAPRPARGARRRPGRSGQAGPIVPVTPDNRASAEARLPAPARPWPYSNLAADLGADLHGSAAGGGLSTSWRFAWPVRGAGSQATALPPLPLHPPPLLAARSA